MTTPPRIPVYIFNKRKEYSPLGLGMVLSHAQLARGGELARAFDFRPRMHSSLRSLLSDIDMTGPGIVLFSNFMWNSELHDAVGAAVKRFSPQSIVVHGGPSVPRNEAMCSDYFAARPYLDIVAKVREATVLPLAAYNVSGEYAMIKAAAKAGMLDERRATLEALLSIKRAGADFILTYHALEASQWLG